MRKIIAIDFDGCLVESQWPEIGAPRWDVIDAAREERKRGSALILWTCRSGRYLDEAVDFCRKIGLLFDAVNDNLPEVVNFYGGSNCRKIVADEYWDDHAVRVPASEVISVETIVKMLVNVVCGSPCDYVQPSVCSALCACTADGTCPGDYECWRQNIRDYQRKEAAME